MKILVTKHFNAEIDPQEVIKRLISDQIGKDYIYEENGKFFRVTEGGAGTHSFDITKPMSVEKYRYAKALQLVLECLSKYGGY